MTCFDLSMTSAPAPAAPEPSGRWYAVACHKGREEIAVHHLTRQAFQPFLPRIRQTRAKKGRFETRVSPFFPGYLFLQMDIARQRWRHINSTIGIKSLVMMGEMPVAVPRGVVEDMLSIADTGSILDLNSGLQEGGRVQLIAGPFATLLGTLQKLDDSGRVRVLVDIMNGTVPLSMSVRDIVPAA